VDVTSTSLVSEAPGQLRVVDLEERSWLGRHCRGDQSAFPTLLTAYRRPVYSYLVRSGVAEAERDDLFQSIFLKIHAAARSYEPSRPLAPWLFTIAANTVRNHVRGRAKAPATVTEDDTQELADPAPGPEQVAQARETLAWLEEALAVLPAVQREIVLSTTVLGLRQEDVAQALNMPLNTVKTHLRRARLALAQGLARRESPAGSTGENDEHL
jgi:RNA polymerase sigma-70 factor (ECF subfamily)